MNRWLTNVMESEAFDVISRLTVGQPERRLFVGDPKETIEHDMFCLKRMRVVGIYETNVDPASPSTATQE